MIILKYLTEETYFSNQEIAEWFGVKKNTIIKSRKQKEEELSHYCTFERTPNGRGFIIHKVYYPEFIPQRELIKQKMYDKLLYIIIDGELMTIDMKAQQFYNILKKDPQIKRLSLGTAISVFQELKIEKFGRSESYGTMGYNERIWVKKISKSYYLMNDEEKEIWRECLDKFFNRTAEETLQEKIAGLIQDKKNNQLDTQDFKNLIATYEKNFYEDLLCPAAQALKCDHIVRITVIHIDGCSKETQEWIKQHAKKEED